MTLSTTPVFVQTPKVTCAKIANTDASALVDIITGATNGSKIVSIIVTSDDTSARDISFGVLKNGGAWMPLGTKTVAIAAGTAAGTPAVNMMDTSVVVGMPVDNDGQSYLFLEASDKIQAKSLTTITNAKFVYFTTTSASF